MHPDVNEWGGRLAALPEFEAPAAGWQAVLAARKDREARLDRRWPMALAAAVLVATAGLAWWLQSAQRELTADALRRMQTRCRSRPRSAPKTSVSSRFCEPAGTQRHAGSTAFTVAELEDRRLRR
jgi:hypothetical protein